MLYRHNDINHNSNTNTSTNTGGLFCLWYQQVYSFLASVHGHTRRETQFLKVYANHIMLIHPNVWCILWCLRSQFISASRDPKNGRNSTAVFNGLISTIVLSKSSHSQDHLFWAWCHLHSSPISCLAVYYDKWCLSYPLRMDVRLHQMPMHLD